MVLSEVSADVSGSPFCLTLACYQAAFCLPWSADNQSEAGSAVRRSRLAPGTRPGSPHPARQRASARCRFLWESPARGGGAQLTAPAASAPSPFQVSHGGYERPQNVEEDSEPFQSVCGY